MSFGGDCLIKRIDERILGIEGSTYKSSQLSGAIDAVKTSFCCVPTVNDLPAASCNEGRFIYVEDIKSFRYSDGFFWTKDACTVLGDVNTNGGLWSWGCNGGGILGDGTTVSRCSPGTIWCSDSKWCNISENDGPHSVAIKTDGTLWSWGCNNVGQLGDGTTVNRCSPGTIAGGGTTWCQVSGGCCNTAAIKSDGTLWTWGCNNVGQLGDGTIILKSSPGTIWGGGTTWCQVSGGKYHIAAIKTDGTLWTWGCNCCGILGDGTTLNRCSPGTVWNSGTTWCQVSSGNSQTSAVKIDGTLWTWGSNASGGLGEGTTVNRCSPGTVWGSYTTWCSVSTGFFSGMALKCDGTLWTWGNNPNGQLGEGSAVPRCSPGTVAGGGNAWCQISMGANATAAIKTDGTLWTWGSNANGTQLGDGTTVSRRSPGTVIGGGNTWCKVSANQNLMMAIKTRGF